MKKFVIFLIIVVIIVGSISYLYIIEKANQTEINKQNVLFENYYQRKIYGADLATLINKAIDLNIKNNVEKDEKNFFIENDKNSILITIKMIDNDTIYSMESFANQGISTFLEYYNKIQFQCNKMEYHENTHMVKNMLFEQITV